MCQPCWKNEKRESDCWNQLFFPKRCPLSFNMSWCNIQRGCSVTKFPLWVEGKVPVTSGQQNNTFAAAFTSSQSHSKCVRFYSILSPRRLQVVDVRFFLITSSLPNCQLTIQFTDRIDGPFIKKDNIALNCAASLLDCKGGYQKE